MTMALRGRNAMAKTKTKAKSKPKTATRAKKAPPRSLGLRRATALVGPPPSLTIVDVNGIHVTGNPIPCSMSQLLTVEGVSTVTVPTIRGQLSGPGGPYNQTTTGTGPNWTVTWAANTITSAGNYLCSIFASDGSCSDTVILTFS
jgi:hypothetical protein